MDHAGASGEAAGPAERGADSEVGRLLPTAHEQHEWLREEKGNEFEVGGGGGGGGRGAPTAVNLGGQTQVEDDEANGDEDREEEQGEEMEVDGKPAAEDVGQEQERQERKRQEQQGEQHEPQDNAATDDDNEGSGGGGGGGGEPAAKRVKTEPRSPSTEGAAACETVGSPPSARPADLDFGDEAVRLYAEHREEAVEEYAEAAVAREVARAERVVRARERLGRQVRVMLFYPLVAPLLP